jgi:hypothetical protein
MRSPCVTALEAFMLEPLDRDQTVRSLIAVAAPVPG